MIRGFAGKKVFITGGSSGIGKAMALLLARADVDVMIAARGEARLQQALAELRAVAHGNRVEAITLDVGDRSAVLEAVPEVLERLGGLDILVNNAGVTHPARIQEIPPEVFDQLMRINYFGTVNVTRAFLPQLIAQHGGHICNVSSLLGFMGIYGYTAYAASKFAVAGFSDCLRQELLPHHIGISVVFPADTDTPQFQEENRIKPEETRVIAGNVKVMQPDAVAQEILKGIADGAYHIIPGMGSKFTYFMYRHFPWAVRWVIDNDLKKCQRRTERPHSRV